MSIQELRTEKERTLHTISLVVSCIFWGLMVLGTLGLGLFYIAAGAGFVLMTQALFLAALKGNGVRITAEQLPELHARIQKAAEKLGLAKAPEAYLVNHRGMFNAFAMRFLDRDFVVLYADLLEACDEEDGSIDFIIGHELGHLALGHTKIAPLFLPSRMLPLLSQAYSRACEYSCDRAGTVVAGRSEGAVRGLAVLAAGGRYAKRLDTKAFLAQRLETGGFWMSVVELGMTHPYLPKRMGAILADTRPEVEVPKVERNPLAYVMSPMFAGGAAGAGVFMAVMVAGVLAAIAVPAFARYKASSVEAALDGLEADKAASRELERALNKAAEESAAVAPSARDEAEAAAAPIAEEAEPVREAPKAVAPAPRAAAKAPTAQRRRPAPSYAPRRSTASTGGW